MDCVGGSNTCSSTNESAKPRLSITSYAQQRKLWPASGRHVVAQFDDDSVVVYQAFRPSIAEYAVHNQSFGGPDFSYERMSWIKTSFLWMMYRCGWATKHNQERILAVRICREGFNTILNNAYNIHRQRAEHVPKEDLQVRLQWDPDHDPTGEKETRRAIQLGLKYTMLKKYGMDWVKNIDDITPFVREQHEVLTTKGVGHLQTPAESVYPVPMEIALKIDVDSPPTWTKIQA